jgi:hypothetical protein
VTRRARVGIATVGCNPEAVGDEAPHDPVLAVEMEAAALLPRANTAELT